MENNNIISDDEYRPLCLEGTDSQNYRQPIIYFQSGMSSDKASTDIQQESDKTETGAMQADTTHFVDEGITEIVRPAKYLTLPKTSLSTAETNVQSITDFMAKPRVVIDANITPGTGPSRIATLDVGAFVYPSSSATDIWKDKIKGVYGIKYDSVFTLKINGSRFAQGLLMMAFCPGGGTNSSDTFYRMYNNSRMQASQMKHVTADVNCDSSVTLEVPWVSAYPFQKLDPYATSREGSPGLLCLYVYSMYDISDIAPTGTLRISVFQSLKNIEFFGNAVPQSEIYDLDLQDIPCIRFQAGNVKRSNKKKDVMTEEEESNRPISKGFRLIADVSSALSTVPLLSSFTAPISWVTDAISRAAYVWGYSAPRIVSPPIRAFPSSTPYLTTYDKHSTAEPLSLALSNKLSPALGFSGTDKDEMSIDFIKGIFSFYNEYNWSSGQADETKLFTIELNPLAWSSSIASTAGGSYFFMTPSCYLARQFLWWRGSIKFRIYLVKTEFHIGRLAFAYSPNGTTGSYDDTDYLLREIVDIRSGNMVEITIPYVSDKYWQDTLSGDSIGNLDVYIIDTLGLGTMATTTTNVKILVEVAMGDDAQFAVRSNRRMIACNAATTFQSGTEMDPCAIEVTNIGSSSATQKDYSIMAMCVGEPVESLSQLLKAGGFNLCETSTTGRGLAHSISATNSTSTFPNQQADMFTSIVPLYALMRGGVRATYQTTERTLTSPLVVFLTFGNSNRVPFLRASTEYITRTTMMSSMVNSGSVISTADNGAVCVDFPPYCRFPSAPVAQNMIYDGSSTSAYRPGTISTNYVVRCLDPTVTPTLFVHRSAADDFRCGVFIAIPILYVHNYTS